MADIGIRVTVDGADASQQSIQKVGDAFKYFDENVAKVKTQLSDLNAKLSQPITSVGGLDKALQSLYGAQKSGVLSFQESERRAQALGVQYKHLTDSILPGANKGFADLARTLTDSAVSASGLSRITNQVQGVSAALEGVGGISGRAALGFAALGAAAVASIGFVAMKVYDAVESTTALGDHLNNLSQRTGIAVEKLSGGLKLAAETTGSSIDSLATGMNQLNRAISEAADGTGKQAEAFKRLGISVTDADGKLKSADQVLEEIAVAFAGAEDGAVKAEIAMTLLGRAGVNLIPLLNQGADGLNKLEREAKLAGITMDKETADAASKLNENMRVLKAYGEGFWISVASPLVEGLAKITTAMRLARSEGDGFFSSMVVGAREMWTALFLPSTKSALSQKGMEIAGWIAVIKQQEEHVAQGDKTPQTATMLKNAYSKLQAAYAAQGELENQSYVESPQFAADLAGPKVVLPSPTPKEKKGPEEQTNSQVVSEYLTYYNNLVKIGEMTQQEQLVLLDEMAVEFQNYEDERVKIMVASSEIRKKIATDETKFAEAAAKAEVTVQKMAAKDTAEAWGFVFKQRKKETDELDKINDRSSKIEIGQINETTYLFKEHKMAALADLERQYVELGDVSSSRLIRVRSEMEALKGTTKATGVIVQDVGFDMGKVWQGVHTGLTQGIGDIARYALGISSNIKSLGDALKGFFLSIVNSIIDTFAKIAANQVFIALFGGGGAATGAGIGGSLASGAASGASSGILGNVFGSAAGSEATGGGGGLIGMASTGISKAFGGSGSLLFDAFGIGSAPTPAATYAGFNAATNALGIGAGAAEIGVGGALGAGAAGFEVGAGAFAAGAEVAGLGAFAGIGAALPWIGGALLIANMLGLFGGGGGPKPQEFGIINGHISQNNYLQGFDDMWQEADRMLFQSGVYAPGVNTGYGGVSDNPASTLGAYLSRIEGSRIAPFPNAWFSDWSARAIERTKPAVFEGWGDSGGGYATGTDMIVSKPTMFQAGEVGTERVTVSPIGAARHGMGGGPSLNFNGPVVMDYYTMRKFVRDLERYR